MPSSSLLPEIMDVLALSTCPWCSISDFFLSAFQNFHVCENLQFQDKLDQLIQILKWVKEDIWSQSGGIFLTLDLVQKSRGLSNSES